MTCDKPDGYKPCGYVEPTDCTKFGMFVPKTNYTVPTSGGTLNISYSVSDYTMYSVSSSDSNFRVQSKTPSGCTVDVSEYTGTSSDRRAVITISADKVDCGILTREVVITQPKRDACLDFSAEFTTTGATISSNGGNVTISYTLKSCDSFSLSSSDKTNFQVISSTASSCTVFVTEYLNTNEDRSAVITLVAAKCGCKSIRRKFTITQTRRDPCLDFNANITSPSQQIASSGGTVTIQYTISGQDSYTVTSSDNENFYVSSQSLTGCTVLVGEYMNTTTNRSATITLTAKKSGCSNITKQVTVTQIKRDGCIDFSANITSGDKTVSAVGEDVQVDYTMSGQDSYDVTSSDSTNFRIASKTQTNCVVRVSQWTDTTRDRSARITLTVTKSGCSTITKYITITQQKALPCPKPTVSLTCSQRTIPCDASTYATVTYSIGGDNVTFSESLTNPTDFSVVKYSGSEYRVSAKSALSFGDSPKSTRLIVTAVNNCGTVSNDIEITQAACECTPGINWKADSKDKVVESTSTSVILNYEIPYSKCCPNGVTVSSSNTAFRPGTASNGSVTISYDANEDVSNTKETNLTITCKKNGQTNATDVTKLTQRAKDVDGSIRITSGSTTVPMTGATQSYTATTNYVVWDRVEIDPDVNVTISNIQNTGNTSTTATDIKVTFDVKFPDISVNGSTSVDVPDCGDVITVKVPGYPDGTYNADEHVVTVCKNEKTYVLKVWGKDKNNSPKSDTLEIVQN